MLISNLGLTIPKHHCNEAVLGVEKDGELMEEVESIEEKLWKVKTIFK